MRRAFLLIAIALLMSVPGLAQVNDALLEKFQWSLTKNLDYPEYLRETCTATFTVLKVGVDANGKVSDMTLSDSALPLFNMEFILIVDKLDKVALQQIVLNRKLSATTLLMPIYYSVKTASCKSPTIDPNSLYNAYKFNKEDFRATAVMLPPLILNVIRESIH